MSIWLLYVQIYTESRVAIQKSLYSNRTVTFKVLLIVQFDKVNAGRSTYLLCLDIYPLGICEPKIGGRPDWAAAQKCYLKL